jgi:O-antigen/teichoic acid export membrane protein
MSLAGQIKRGVFWVAVSTLIARMLSYVAYFILARMLAPADFGLVAGAYLAIDALLLFQEAGLGSALIYRKEDVEEAANTAFYLIVITAVLAYGVAYAASPWVSYIAQQPDPRICPILRVLALTLVISSFGRVPMVLLAKQLDFRRRLLPSVMPSLVYAILAPLLALAGLEVWSIVIARLAASVIQAAAIWWVTGWRPQRRFSRELARDLFDYGKHIIASQVLIFGITNIDDGFVIRMLGWSDEGAYDLAYRTSNIPATQITALVNQVMFPAFARVQDDLRAFRRIYFRTLRYVSLLAIPVAAGTLLLAPDLVAAIDSEKWAGAVLPMQLLGIYGLLRAVAGNMGNVFKGGGKPDWLTGIAIWRFVTMALLLYPATSAWGITGVAGLSAAVSIVDFFISGTLANRVIDSSWKDHGRVLLPILGATAVAGALAEGVQQVAALETGVIALLVGGTVLVLAYGLLIGLTQPDLRRQALALPRQLGGFRQRLRGNSG